MIENPFDSEAELKANQQEFKLHVCIVEQISRWYPQVAFIHIPNRPGNATDGYFKKLMGAEAGAPDLLFTWRAFGKLCGGLLELKAGSGKLKPSQNKFLSHWSGLGWHTGVAYSAAEAFNIIRDWGLEPASIKIMEPDLRTDMQKKSSAFNFYWPND